MEVAEEVLMSSQTLNFFFTKVTIENPFMSFYAIQRNFTCHEDSNSVFKMSLYCKL